MTQVEIDALRRAGYEPRLEQRSADRLPRVAWWRAGQRIGRGDVALEHLRESEREAARAMESLRASGCLVVRAATLRRALAGYGAGGLLLVGLLVWRVVRMGCC